MPRNDGGLTAVSQIKVLVDSYQSRYIPRDVPSGRSAEKKVRNGPVYNPSVNLWPTPQTAGEG